MCVADIFYIGDIHIFGQLQRGWHCLNKNQNASKTSEHAPNQWGNTVEKYIWGHRLNARQLLMGFNVVPRRVVVYDQQYNVGEKPAVILYTYIIAIQVHQNRGKRQRYTKIKLFVIMLYYFWYRIQVLTQSAK